MISKPLWAIPSKSSVIRGGETEIVLRSSPNYHNQVRFEICDPPAHGNLSQPRLTGEESASVIYRHDGDEKSRVDHFSFRVFSAGRSPSAPAICDVSVMPRPGRLSVDTEVLDFGRAIGGEGISRQIVLKNEGEVPITIRLGTSVSFLTTESSCIRLEGGERRRMRVQFQPSQTGKREGVLEIAADDGHGIRRITCFGEVLPRFAFSGGSDQATMTFTNLSARDLVLKFTEPPGWSHPEDLHLPSSGCSTLTLRPAFGNRVSDGSKSLPLRVSDGLSVCEVPLPKPLFLPFGMIWKSATPPVIRVGEELGISVGISNPATYERSITWALETSGCNNQSTRQESLLIPPFGEMLVTNSWKPTNSGNSIVTISVHEEGCEAQRLSWRTSVEESSPVPVSSPLILPSPPPAPVGEQSKPFRESLPAIPGLEISVKKNWMGNPFMNVSWSAGVFIREAEVWRLVPGKVPEDPESLTTENRLAPEALFEQIQQSFQPHLEGGKLLSLRIPHLAPGSWFFRVKLTGDGDCGDFLSNFTVEIPPAPNFPIWSLVMIAVTIVGVVYLIRRRSG